MAKRFSWKSHGRKESKPWGDEEIFSAPWGTCGKILHIEKEHRTSLKAYKMKNEILYLAKGKILVLHGNEDQDTELPYEEWRESILVPGELVLIQAGCPYRVTALEDSVIVEVTHGGNAAQNEAIRYADDYGRIVEVKNN